MSRRRSASGGAIGVSMILVWVPRRPQPERNEYSCPVCYSWPVSPVARCCPSLARQCSSSAGCRRPCIRNAPVPGRKTAALAQSRFTRSRRRHRFPPSELTPAVPDSCRATCAAPYGCGAVSGPGVQRIDGDESDILAHDGGGDPVRGDPGIETVSV